MKTIATIALAVLAAVSFAPNPAAATTADECKTQITALSAATTAATFERDELGAKAQAKLLFHLEKASELLDKSDNRNASHQIRDYVDDVNNAVRSRKLSAEAAAPLIDAANAIAACIDGIA